MIKEHVERRALYKPMPEGELIHISLPMRVSVAEDYDAGRRRVMITTNIGVSGHGADFHAALTQFEINMAEKFYETIRAEDINAR
jgi:hypothetical protein